MKSLCFVFTLVFALFLTVTAPAVAHAASIDEGSRIFSANCAACHMGGGNNIMRIKTLQQDALEKFLAGYGVDHDEKAIVKQVTYGKGMMPGFRNRLSDDEIESVAAYVKSQAENGW
ncbi:MAG: c-type cytochrome [Cyanobacteria bacterium J06627_8]